MEDILTMLGYSLEKKLDVGDDLVVWDTTIGYLSRIIGLEKFINPSNLNQRYTNHQDFYLVNDQFFNAILKREFKRIPWKYKAEQSQRPEMATKLFFLANIIETFLYYTNHQKKLKTDNIITASDIAMYAFCPASYSIHKSYDLKESPLTDNGKKYHEGTRLINKIKKGEIEKENKTDIRFFKESEKDYKRFLDEIDNSKLIFSGHSETDKNKYFKKNDFVCQPDYIFQDRNSKHFVVEEKFRFVGKKSVEKHNSYLDKTYYETEDDFNDVFYTNHILQLASYIYGIEELKIEYGYLVYWQIKDDKVVKCNVKKIARDFSLLENLRQTFRRVKAFNADKVINFDVGTLNENKCTNCSVAALCGHKHRLFPELKIPYYEGKYISLRRSDLPNELTEYKEEFSNFLSPNYQCQVCHNWHIGSDISSALLSLSDYQQDYKFQIVSPIYNQSKRIELKELSPFTIDINNYEPDYFSHVDYLMRHTFLLDKICVKCKMQKDVSLDLRFIGEAESLNYYKKVKLTDFNISEMKSNGISYKVDEIRKNIVLTCKFCNTIWEPDAEYSRNLLDDESPKCPKCDLSNLLKPIGNINPEIQSEIEMVFIESGTFNMGNRDCLTGMEPERYMDDFPIHAVNVSSFYLAKYPITQSQWYAVMGCYLSDPNGCSDCPVENASWEDAQLFIGRLNERTGENFRLPTEAEWEYAARGGKNSSDTGKHTKSFKHVRFEDRKVHAVGKGEANLLGIFDMSENVYEWCHDFWFDDYSEDDYSEPKPMQNPQGPDIGTSRVLRGGWCGGRFYYRSTYRAEGNPNERSKGIGFRIAKTL